jgi:hypothetical protein
MASLELRVNWSSESASRTLRRWKMRASKIWNSSGSHHAQREYGDRSESESGRAAQDAGAIAEILPQAIEPDRRPHLTRILAQAGGVAEVRAAIGRHHGAVGLHLLSEFALQARAAQQKIDPSE